MLGRFIVTASQIGLVPSALDGHIACLSDSDCERASSIEAKAVVETAKPTYCEAGVDQLDEVKCAGGYAKVRTGGITAEAIPSVDALANFINGCADRRLPFKATAGLHHPVRSMQPLSCEKGAARAVMHGFVNVMMAAGFAWRGERKLVSVLAETDPQAFWFDDRAHWRDQSLAAMEIQDSRHNFMHSFGSCSFEEPVQDLEGLGWL
jgi:hypothetical protein